MRASLRINLWFEISAIRQSTGYRRCNKKKSLICQDKMFLMDRARKCAWVCACLKLWSFPFCLYIQLKNHEITDRKQPSVCSASKGHNRAAKMFISFTCKRLTGQSFQNGCSENFQTCSDWTCSHIKIKKVMSQSISLSQSPSLILLWA